MGRCTEILTLYFPQPCLKGRKPYAEIRRVKNYREERLSWTKGNVNLTDYWYAMADIFMTQDMAYTCQHIDLLCDDETGWWQNQIDVERNWTCLGFIKWKRDCKQYREIEKELQKDGKDHRFFRTFGNADCIYVFSAESEETLLEKLEEVKKYVPFFFSSYYFYGQCRVLEGEIWRIEPYIIPEGGNLDGHVLCENGWGAQTIGMLREAVRDSRRNKNKKMMAYYQALGQIVNIVAQYEQSPVFKDLYYMFYPPISLFWSQLKKAEGDIEKIQDDIVSAGRGEDIRALTIEKNVKMRKVEISISDFIDSMEILLHHMGHSCRDILSDAGRGGIPYDIPLRLCLMYVAYLHVFTAVINDRDYRFEYCLVPLAYSRPVTRYFDFDLPPEGRLIRVQISRHMMFMPRSLLIILGHEVSHYVSEAPRMRELRAECCINIMNTAVTMQLIPENFLENLNLQEQEKHRPMLERYLVSVRRRVVGYLNNNVREKWGINSTGNYKYHFDDFLDNLEKTYREILVDEEKLLSWNIEYIDEEIIGKLRVSDSLFQNIMNIQETLNERRRSLLDNAALWDFQEKIFENLRECYSDLLSISVLGVTWKEFVEAYIISESYVPDEEQLPAAVVNRFAVVKYLLGEDGKSGWARSGTENGAQNKAMDEFLQKAEQQVNAYLSGYCGQKGGTKADQKGSVSAGGKKQQVSQAEDISSTDQNKNDQGNIELFYFKEIVEHEICYLQKCYKKIGKMIAEEKRRTLLNLVRNLYRHFLVRERSQDSSYHDFFKAYDKLVEFYKENTEKNYGLQKPKVQSMKKSS